MVPSPDTATVRPEGKTKLPFQAPEKLCVELIRHGRIFTAEKGTVLFRAGQANKGVYVVLTGRVALTAGQDRSRVTRMAQRNCLLGVPATFRRKPYSLSAEVTEEAELCRISPANFMKYMASHPAHCYCVMQMLSEEVATLRDIINEKA